MDSLLDSGSSCGDDGDDEVIKPPLLPTIQPAELDAMATTTRPKHVKHEFRDFIWENSYFYIPSRHKQAGFRVWMRRNVENELGSDSTSKYITPEQVGENSQDDCPVTLLLLRAWVLWRAYRDGWATQKPSRQREFEEEKLQLRQAISKIQGNSGGSLGHPKADALWNTYLRQAPWPQV